MLRQIIPTADRAKATVQVKVKIIDPGDRLLPEMSSSVSFLQSERTDAEMHEPAKIWLPASAVVRRPRGRRRCGQARHAAPRHHRRRAREADRDHERRECRRPRRHHAASMRSKNGQLVRVRIVRRQRWTHSSRSTTSRKVYKRDAFEVPVLNGVTLAVPRGDFLALMGPSGSGKTTLLNLIAGIDRPTGGRIIVDGKEISRFSETQLASWRSRHVGFIFQMYNLIPVLNAFENVELPLLLTKLSKKERREHVQTALGIVGLGDRIVPLSAAALRRSGAARGHRARHRHRSRRSSSPTSRPATSTRRTPRRCSSCCSG